jgi:hypothetical protein
MNENTRNLFKNGVLKCYAGNARVSIKRLTLNGYESEWFDISKYVIKYPKIKRDFGDESHLGNFKTQRASITLLNNNGQFSGIENPRSFFNKFVDRARTKLKMEFVIFDEDDNEVIADTSFFYVYGEIIEKKGQCKLPLRDLLHALKKESCDGVTFTQGMSISDMIKALLQKEVLGGRIFDSFLEGSTDEERYVIPKSDFIPSSIADYQSKLTPDKSIFKIISRYCLFLNGFLFVNSDGNFELNINREVNNDVGWHFNYLTSFDEYGSNVVSLDVDSGVKDIYNTVYIKYGESDSDIFVKKINYNPTEWYTSQSNRLYFVYGEKKYSSTFHELSLNTSSIDSSMTEVEELSTRIFEYYKNPKKTYSIEHTPCVLRPLDRVVLNAQGRLEIGPNQNPLRLGVSSFGDGSVLAEQAGPINETGKELKVISSEYDLNSFKFKTKLKEI